jgi:hypothetical protein
MATTRKVASKKSEPPMHERIVSAIRDGAFDDHISAFDDAIQYRMEQHTKQTTKKASSSSTTKEKVVPQPTRASASGTVKKPRVKLEEEGVYTVDSNMKTLGGARVKFLRFKRDKETNREDKSKAVVEMLVDKPGNPKGKRMIVAASALGPYKPRGKRK